MKNLLLSGFIGIAIVVALETLFRVLISVLSGHDITIVHFQPYDGLHWKLLIAVFSFVSAFAGGVFSVSYHKQQRRLAFILFAVLLILVKYGQVHLMIDLESLVFPIISLVFALIGLLIVWKFRVQKSGDLDYEETTNSKRHHQPSDENT